MRYPLLALALTAMPLVAAAQQSSSQNETEDVRRYTVEMIIFEYEENISVGSEIFVPEVLNPRADQDDLQDDSQDADTADDRNADRRVYKFESNVLPRSAFTMNDTWGRLQRLDAYRPLMHFGWTQTTIPEDQTPELSLARFGRPVGGLDGTLKLYLSRFLHLDIDLSMPAPEGASSDALRAARQSAPVNTYADPAARENPGDTYVPEYGPVRYRIAEDRIMKNGDVRYFDHPKFGVIAKVTRVD